MSLMQRKERIPLAKLVSLPPAFDRASYANLLDSIVDVEHFNLTSENLDDKDSAQAKSKPWHKRRHSESLDPSSDASPYYTDYKRTRCLWLANCNLNSNVNPSQVEEEFSDQKFGFCGLLSIHDRSYILLVFKDPESALSTWERKNRTFGESVKKELLLEFASSSLPAPFAQLWDSKYGSSGSKESSSSRYVLDDWREIPGLVVIPNFLTPDHEAHLIELLLGHSESNDPIELETSTEESLSPHGEQERRTKISLTPSANWISLSKRRVQHYGYAFNYNINNVEPQQFLGPLPDFAQKVVEKLNTEILPSNISDRDVKGVNDGGEFGLEFETIRRSLSFKEWSPDQLTINEYRPGQGIPHHIDTHSAFEEMIVSVSIMGDTVMEFCHPDGKIGRKKIYLPRRSLLALTGDARYLWTHGITPRTTDDVHGKPRHRSTRISLTFRTIQPVPVCHCVYPPQCDLWRAGARAQESRIESLHVHDVYDAIATHFDKTRYKPWPRVVDFLLSLRGEGPGKIDQVPLVCDVGCGNGRYMGDDIYDSPNDAYSPTKVGEDYFNVYRVGGDRSGNLMRICREKNRFEVAKFDCLNLPFRANLFDATLCIAVLHHLSTAEHRIRAIEQLIRITKSGGKIAIFVWALNQSATSISDDDNEGKAVLKETSRNFGQQDIFVPWTIENKNVGKSGDEGETQAEPVTLQRYLHVYRNRELAELVETINKRVRIAEVVDEGIDHGNCFVFIKKL